MRFDHGCPGFNMLGEGAGHHSQLTGEHTHERGGVHSMKQVRAHFGQREPTCKCQEARNRVCFGSRARQGLRGGTVPWASFSPSPWRRWHHVQSLQGRGGSLACLLLEGRCLSPNPLMTLPTHPTLPQITFCHSAGPTSPGLLICSSLSPRLFLL